MGSDKAKSKKQRNEECIINCLPGDIIERIFLRLPVSTLLRCVGVCKQWHNFIRETQFVTSHLQHAPRCTLLFFPQETVSGKLYPSDAVLIDEAWSESTWAMPVIEPDDLLCGSCNGLLCLYTKTSTIKIANLATGDCLHLRKPVENIRGDNFSFYSFAFLPVTKEYKITHFLADCSVGRPHTKDSFSVIQVYTLGGEKWKDVGTPEALSLNCVKNSGAVNVDGRMYWLTEDMGAIWQHAVMSFNLYEESYAQIELPTAVLEDYVLGGSRRYWITEIDGKLCIATAEISRYLPRGLAGKLQIWTLDKVEQRWSQKYSIQLPPLPILRPYFVHGDKAVTTCGDSFLYSYELLGKNFEIELSKMVKLLDFCPRRDENMQSYICVKSLVRLDVFKKADIVRRPKRRKGWELKKWKAWEHELCELEELWSSIHELEHDITAFTQDAGMVLNQLLDHISDEVIRQRIGMKINQMLRYTRDFADKQPRSLRRPNWVEQKRDIEKLRARVDKFRDINKAVSQAASQAISMIRSYMQDQKGTWSSNAGKPGISSQNHSDGGDDTKTRDLA